MIDTERVILCLVLLRGVTALTRAVSGEKKINSGNLEILPGTAGNLGSFLGKYEIFSGHSFVSCFKQIVLVQLRAEKIDFEALIGPFI